VHGRAAPSFELTPFDPAKHRRPGPLILTPYDPAEHEMQIDITAALEKILLPDVAWTAIDHGHSFDQRPARVKPGRDGRVPTVGMLEALKRKRRGVRAGVCDYCFWYMPAPPGAFAIELKTPDGPLSDDQRVWIKRMIRAGAAVKVCWSKALVIQTVTEWGLTHATI